MLSNAIKELARAAEKLEMENDLLRQAAGGDVIVIPTDLPFEAMERIILEAVMSKYNWKPGKAGDSLGIPRSTLWRMLNRHGITCSDGPDVAKGGAHER